MAAAITYKANERIPNTRLRYLHEAVRTHAKRRRAMFICDCGNQAEKNIDDVKFLMATSCGCLKSEVVTAKNTKHSQAARGQVSGAYRSWQAMHQRVKTNPRYRDRPVCPRWCGEKGFENFIEDMGERPDGYSIERKDNNLGYEPSNCIWADRVTQASNSSNSVWLEIEGEKHTISEWCRVKGISYSMVKQRRKRGMSLVDAIMTPLDTTKQGNKMKVQL